MPFTAPWGWLGAYAASRYYLETKFGKPVVESAKHVKRIRFSIEDILLQVAVLAIVIGFSTATYRYYAEPRYDFVETGYSIEHGLNKRMRP